MIVRLDPPRRHIQKTDLPQAWTGITAACPRDMCTFCTWCWRADPGVWEIKFIARNCTEHARLESAAG